jgi:isopentenyldiphosphate isomerase
LPGEQDGADGVIIAARRKLEQELGITPDQVSLCGVNPLSPKLRNLCRSCGLFIYIIKAAPVTEVPTESFTFLTRVHYQAPCCDTWGEHEIDYILICRPDADVVVKENPNEVQQSTWFSKEEMRAWMAENPTPGMTEGTGGSEKVSPWYRIIHDSFLYKWWDGLEDLAQFKDYETIFRGEGAEC